MSTAQESLHVPKAESKSWFSQLLLKEYEFFEHSLTLKSRVVILLAVVVLIPAFIFPLWRMSFYSNQYIDGLKLTIYAYQLEGAKTSNRDDLREINALNHYIGMRPLLESEFSEFTWLPFAIGGLMILALRAMVLGKMSKLVDVFVLFAWFGMYSFWSFYHRMYLYGHNLDPQAAIKVEPFTPPLFGTEIVGNFTVYSYPDVASFALVAFGLLMGLAIWLSRKNSEV
jgi:copper chaperone NosL